MPSKSETKIKGGDAPDLEGWKEIADALGVSVSTAKRWQAQGMPVLRWGPSETLIRAYKAEILAWAARPVRGAA